jgi:hypothetical protein
VWIFRGPAPSVLVVHKPIKMKIGFINKPHEILRWKGTAAQMVKSPNITHTRVYPKVSGLSQWQNNNNNKNSMRSNTKDYGGKTH